MNHCILMLLFIKFILLINIWDIIVISTSCSITSSNFEADIIYNNASLKNSLFIKCETAAQFYDFSSYSSVYYYNYPNNDINS